MSNKPLLPLYIVHKQAYRLNEKNIIILVFAAVTLITLVALFKSLPSNNSIDLNTNTFKRILTPEGDTINYKNKTLVNELNSKFEVKNEIKTNKIVEEKLIVKENPIIENNDNHEAEPQLKTKDDTVIKRRTKVREVRNSKNFTLIHNLIDLIFRWLFSHGRVINLMHGDTTS